ncbi:AAA family ATPase [Moraxella boevrei]|uniref:AAA family ATPase n=1 Tax=Faucicola boevrei TaxID=346665 RepID=UPI003736E31F
MTKPIQKIIFGSPGTGKSHLIKSEIIPDLIKDEKKRKSNTVHAVFHPEYTYGDFMGKLLPITADKDVEYRFYEGHFLKALSYAYRNLVLVLDKNGEKTKEPENVVLVIDEINRGNSSAIFGSVFQLLDRNDDGWSSYDTTINGVVFDKFLELIFTDIMSSTSSRGQFTCEIGAFKGEKFDDLQKEIIPLLGLDLSQRNIKIPPNLHIVATMNTSDSSIYHMDTAFKRRWEWQFIDVDDEHSKKIQDAGQGIAFHSEQEWIKFIAKLNQFIKSNHSYIRGIEDKQIGRYFIKGNEQNQIEYSIIQSKLMFFIWDSVFNRDKTPLVKLLFGNDNVEQNKNKLVTFGDFALQVKIFVEKIKNYGNSNV